MTHDLTTPIIITHGNWMHIRHTRVYHRHYPDVRGEGTSPGEAATHLLNQLTYALQCTHVDEREAIERAIGDVRRLLAAGPSRREQPMTATS